MICCGDFNWFVDFVQTNYMYIAVFNAMTENIMISWSQNGIKIQSSYLPTLYSGIPTSEFLSGSAHHRAGTRVFFPGLDYCCIIITHHHPHPEYNPRISCYSVNLLHVQHYSTTWSSKAFFLAFHSSGYDHDSHTYTDQTDQLWWSCDIRPSPLALAYPECHPSKNFPFSGH